MTARSTTSKAETSYGRATKENRIEKTDYDAILKELASSLATDEADLKVATQISLLVLLVAMTVYVVAFGIKAQLHTKSALAFAFAFVSGYADVICFVRYDAFATMMTGNVLQIVRTSLATEVHTTT